MKASLQARLAILQEKIEQLPENLRSQFNPPLAITDVTAVEDNLLRTPLPEAVRLVHMHIADGGNFSRYSTWPLRWMIDETRDGWYNSPEEFAEKLQQAFTPKFNIGPHKDDDLGSGLLLFEHAGCHLFSAVVIRGPHAGEVWQYDPGYWVPFLDSSLPAMQDAQGTIPFRIEQPQHTVEWERRKFIASISNEYQSHRMDYVDYLLWQLNYQLKFPG